MAHEHLEEAKSTQRAKVQTIVGNTKNYRHPTDKASDNYEYYENTKLDPLTMPTRSKVGP
jgi:hypothetical protein